MNQDKAVNICSRHKHGIFILHFTYGDVLLFETCS
jgi:hypothetical protein